MNVFLLTKSRIFFKFIHCFIASFTFMQLRKTQMFFKILIGFLDLTLGLT